ncbi:yjeF N-terminal domain-containing protein 3 isoform X3 [Herpailurus yagouaroundi]|uniref:YjeF N-terminal domain-containing protein 3 isoform X3 n=1 Tax=Acinonyx jubatus TaxID=32536 RepID=A0A6J1XPC5_ACIJB|nr:yjeF N-terminal domain-containing protein 3 isoform X3 [Acinonyx jubatus]XP_040300983.1 yjeF N-terminal domain-containing protein 3 isoform X3 [Puma yagouaroundi]
MSSAARPDPVEAPEERRFLSTAEAAALERELLEDYRFGRQQLVELCGHASAVAVTKVFPLPTLSRKQRTVLVVCGPEQNGAVGLVCARHLRVFVQLINDAYGLVVDAVLGPGVEPGEIGGPCTRALATLKLLSIPLAGTPRPAAATPRTGSDRTCWYRSLRPSAAPAASPAATTSWPADSCPTTCAESSRYACQDTRAPTASRRSDRHPRPRGLDPRQ